jgi:hypothetical protein
MNQRQIEDLLRKAAGRLRKDEIHEDNSLANKLEVEADWIKRSVAGDWDDYKAAEVTRVILVLRPGWESHNEFQACVSVYPSGPGTDEPVFWFGNANEKLTGDFYPTKLEHDEGRPIGLDTGMNYDAEQPERLALAIIEKVEQAVLVYGRLAKATEECQLAFWEKLMEHYPEAKTGDFPPDATVAFDEACEEAVKTWLMYNMGL